MEKEEFDFEALGEQFAESVMDVYVKKALEIKEIHGEEAYEKFRQGWYKKHKYLEGKEEFKSSNEAGVGDADRAEQSYYDNVYSANQAIEEQVGRHTDGFDIPDYPQ